MQFKLTTIGAATGLLLTALMSGCAQKPAEEAAAPADDAAMAPAVEAGVTPSDAAKPILLSTEVLPGDDLGGGTLEQGTLVTGAAGWAAHGEIDGVAWRFGSMDAGRIRVAGVPGTEWQHIQVADSWGVRCMKEPGGATPCLVTRVQPVAPGSLISGGLALDAHTTCVRAADASQGASIAVDGNAAVAIPPGGLCIGGPASDALQQQMLAGTSVTVTGGFTSTATQQSVTLPTHGLKQAMALRGWILEQHANGSLQAEP